MELTTAKGGHYGISMLLNKNTFEEIVEDRNEGLLRQLSKRVGIFSKVAKYANPRSLRMLAEGLHQNNIKGSLVILFCSLI